jgi:hypothetical protein
VRVGIHRVADSLRAVTHDMHERVIQLEMEHFPPAGDRHRAKFIEIVRSTFAAASAPLWQGYVRGLGLLLRITARERSAKPPLEPRPFPTLKTKLIRRWTLAER